jgi:Universal stress protein family
VGGLPATMGAEAVFLTGDAGHALAEESGSLDLLITGSRGYGPLRAVMAGAVTGRLLRDAACPVIVLPRGVDAPFGELFDALRSRTREPPFDERSGPAAEPSAPETRGVSTVRGWPTTDAGALDPT